MASRGHLTQAEAAEQIAEYCSLLWQRGLVTGTSGNVSVRLDGGDVLITPSQRSLRALHPSDLVRVDARGMPQEPNGLPSSELPLHLAAYDVCPEIGVVIHTHPTFCVLCSKSGAVFPRDTVGARETLGRVAWTPYHAPGSAALAQVNAREFANGAEVVLMERHGISAVGATLEQAFVSTDLAEESARLAFYSGLSPAR